MYWCSWRRESESLGGPASSPGQVPEAESLEPGLETTRTWTPAD